jgi:hypothetical protein
MKCSSFIICLASATVSLSAYSLKPAIYTCFYKWKTIYPQAQFPDVYFIVGAFTSAGTVSNAGLLIGIDQVCRDELLKMQDTTTLFAVEVEGMADFLGEMISGKNINQRLHDWAKGKERKIWQAFTKDMPANGKK